MIQHSTTDAIPSRRLLRPSLIWATGLEERPLSPPGPMVLPGQLGGRVGRRRDKFPWPAKFFAGHFFMKTPKEKLGNVREWFKNFTFPLGVGKPRGFPEAPWCNAVLKTDAEWKGALEQTKALGLHPHPDGPKNWDGLAMLDFILRNTDQQAHVLDAGAENYSTILPWLALYGYRNLVGINLTFKKLLRKGPIRYEQGDITQTGFREASFDVVVCQSVIEHGMDIDAYLRETSRILKAGGFLITSTDYYESPIARRDKEAFGVPVKIFSKEEMINLFNRSKQFGLELTNAFDLQCQEKPIHWLALDYTFILFTLRNKAKLF